MVVGHGYLSVNELCGAQLQPQQATATHRGTKQACWPGITESPELRRTLKGHWVQLLALHRTCPGVTPCAWEFIQTLPDLYLYLSINWPTSQKARFFLSVLSAYQGRILVWGKNSFGWNNVTSSTRNTWDTLLNTLKSFTKIKAIDMQTI